MSFNRYLLLLLTLVFLTVLVIGYKFILDLKDPSKTSLPSPTQAPTPAVINNKVKYPEDFTIVLLGDSMTERLGNSDEIRSYLKKTYPTKTVEVLNYGFGSTNILSAPERLTKTTQYSREFRPILDIDFDMIIFESFGINPLSQYPLEEGLKLQTNALDKSVQLIKESNPDAKLVFLATLSPNSKSFGLKTLDLTPQKRAQWVKERVAYIKNHIDYANTHNIPLINVFEKSLQKNGDGNPIYISSDDNIHPSPSGVYLISQEIADFITKQNYPQFTK